MKWVESTDLLVECDLKSQVSGAHHELLDGFGVGLRRRFLGGVRQLADGQHDRVALVYLVFDAVGDERLQLVVNATRLYRVQTTPPVSV